MTNIINNPPVLLACNDGKTYYCVSFRMYLHFDSLSIPVPSTDVYRGSIFAPVKLKGTKMITTAPHSIFASKSFRIDTNKVSQSIESYVINNIDTYREDHYWDMMRRLTISDYVEYLNKKYNIDLDPSSLSYSVQYCWSVDRA